MEKLKAIIFDFDNTLVDYIKLDTSSLETVLKLLPIKLDNDSFIDTSVKYLLEFYKDFDQGLENAENIHRYRLEKTLSFFNISWDDKYLEAYLKHFLSTSYCFDNIEELLKYAYSKVKLAIL